ncbi:hypothetical protein GCM10027280_04440 [Micromonospora polyrhachis]|uniref:Outer membrane murein-binding lipoprotein Lpp n=1 Tax=Micromonospora polyrhachis TaxID=1282883 RepID=A0A7W7WN49_9ACTN|nr:hypothetical protein [Micromonospora polyrhachis]MBB4957257.1 outer membrane murein-binding lipoprotein Lpp [Micromonospora polyrhachis]
MSYPPPGYGGTTPPGNPSQPGTPGGQGYPPPNAGSVYGAPASGAPAPGTPAPTAPMPAYHQTAYPPAENPGAPASGGYPGTAGPVSTPPFGGGPVSSPPVPSQQTYPTGQASAPPFGQPMSGPPTSYGTPASGAGGGGAGRKVLVLAIVAGLLFVIGGVMTGLFVAKSNELSRTEKQLTAQVADRDGKIDLNTKEIEKLKQDLQTANDKVKSVEQDLTGTKNDRDEQARQKQVIGKCLNQLTAALSAAAANNKAAYDQAMKGLNTICNEAEKYL